MRIETAFTADIAAPFESVWPLLLDKVKRPDRYIDGVSNLEIVERRADSVLRSMEFAGDTVRERITVDEDAGVVTFTQVDHPFLAGELTNRLETVDGDSCRLTFAVDYHVIGPLPAEGAPTCTPR